MLVLVVLLCYIILLVVIFECVKFIDILIE